MITKNLYSRGPRDRLRCYLKVTQTACKRGLQSLVELFESPRQKTA